MNKFDDDTYGAATSPAHPAAIRSDAFTATVKPPSAGQRARAVSAFDDDTDKESAAASSAPPPANRSDAFTATVKQSSAVPTPHPPDTVRLRGATVALASDVGGAFVADCVRNVEGIQTDAEIKRKWELSDEDWADLANNAALLEAVRAERERRVSTGECTREAAQRHLVKAPNVLNRILTDEQVAPRHRIEAARELRQAAASDPEIKPGQKQKFVLVINLGADKEVYEKEIDARGPILSDDGQPS